MTFLEALAEQRWDDHRYYHHNRINQALHLVSAVTFIAAYVLLFIEPVCGGDAGVADCDAVTPDWPLLLRAARLRRGQSGDARAQGRDQGRLQPAPQDGAAHDLGARRRWCCTSPTRRSAACCRRSTAGMASLNNLAIMWLVLGCGAIVFRSVQLFFLRTCRPAWCGPTKILTDPFHDVKLYHKAPDAGAPRRAVRPGGIARRGRGAVVRVRGQGRVSAPSPNRRAAIISRSTCRRIALLVGAAPCSHQPSSRIRRAAATKRSPTASTSASV